MNLTEAIQVVETDEDFTSDGYVFVNDDKEIFWSNMRPSIQEGFWGSDDRGFFTTFLGVYSGDAFWTQTLRAL